jgi:hypothetical protein
VFANDNTFFPGPARSEHHDHSGCDRLPPTVICGGCNLADAIAKRSCAAPDWFSFSPAEIRQFVTGAKDNGPVFIDAELARSILFGLFAVPDKPDRCSDPP